MQFLQIQHILSLPSLLHMRYVHGQPHHTDFEDQSLKHQWLSFCLKMKKCGSLVVFSFDPFN